MSGRQPRDTFGDVLDNAPPDDVAEQQRPAYPDPAADEVDDDVMEGVGDVLDADPADIADQRRDAPVLDETEPWP